MNQCAFLYILQRSGTLPADLFVCICRAITSVWSFTNHRLFGSLTTESEASQLVLVAPASAYDW